MSSTKRLSDNKQFKKQKRTETVSATYYEPVTPIPFTTKLDKVVSEGFEVDAKVRDSDTYYFLLGCIPIVRSVKHKYIREKRVSTSYFCEITPEMTQWIESMTPYLQENFRSRGKLQFKLTEDEIVNKTEFRVYPYIVESANFSGIAWRRYKHKPAEIPLDV